MLTNKPLSSSSVLWIRAEPLNSGTLDILGLFAPRQLLRFGRCDWLLGHDLNLQPSG